MDYSFDYFEPLPAPSSGSLDPEEIELLALIGALES